MENIEKIEMNLGIAGLTRKQHLSSQFQHIVKNKGILGLTNYETSIHEFNSRKKSSFTFIESYRANLTL